MECPIIMAVLLEDRESDAPSVQEVFTRFGSAIRVRLGVHATDHPSRKGLILLQLCCDEGQHEEMLEVLNAMPRVRAQSMTIEEEG